MRTYQLRIFAIAALSATIACSCAATHQDNAQQALGRGDYATADYQITQALAADPNNLEIRSLAARIFTQEGVAHYQHGEMIMAGNLFHRAIDYSPTYGPAYDYLGLIAFSQQNWQEAISYGEQGAGYSGKPIPSYVQQAREQLKRVRSGQLFLKRPPPPQ